MKNILFLVANHNKVISNYLIELSNKLIDCRNQNIELKYKPGGTEYIKIKDHFDTTSKNSGTNQRNNISEHIDNANINFKLSLFHEREQNDDSILKHHEMVASPCDPEARYQLANFYKQHGMKKLAKYYWKKVIELGQSESLNCNIYQARSAYSLAMHYKHTENWSTMFKYLKLAIKLGNADAAYDMGKYWQSKNKFSRMEKYFLLSSELGHTEVINELVQYYESNNPYKNIDFYLKAANHGHVMAMFRLAKHYAHIGNYNRMFENYVTSINGGYEKALYHLRNFVKENAAITLEYSIECQSELETLEHENHKLLGDNN